MEGCLASLVTREMQTKATVKSPLTFTRLDVIKTTEPDEI
jgi:hypothetical protein